MRTELPTRRFIILGDAVNIKQVLTNLVLNSITLREIISPENWTAS